DAEKTVAVVTLIFILNGRLDACQVLTWGTVMRRSTAMTAESAPQDSRRSRGDRQRDAIVAAVRELLQERSFADLSVSTLRERAGGARSGFYFYFDSKYAVLALILADDSELLDSLTHHFAPREPGETPAAFAKRMVGSAATVYANDDPVLKACEVARNTDAQI